MIPTRIRKVAGDLLVRWGRTALTLFGLSLGLSLVALFAVGAGVSLLTGRGLLFSGFRQLGIGLVAAAVTYAIGSLIGVSMAG